MTAHISYMFYSPFPPWIFPFFSLGLILGAAPPLLALHLVNQPAAEGLFTSACQIETLLRLARGLLPSPSANTGLDSYHVSSHYQQSRAPGRQWEESGWGMERRRPSITLWLPGPLTAIPLKHSPVKLGRRHTPGGGHSDQTKEGDMRRGRASLVDFMSL